MEDQFGKVSRQALEAGFGEGGAITLADEVDEVILLELALEPSFLLAEVFVVAAFGNPVGDIAAGDAAA